MTRPPRRWGFVIAGIVGAVLALLVLGGGFAVSMGATAALTLDPVGKARTPDVITFQAEKARYEIYAVHERRQNSIGSAASFECAVTLANDRVITIDGSVQAVSDEVANTQSIGSFKAVPGETVIDCDAGRNGETFIVDKESPWRQAGFIATIAGAVMLLLAAGAIVFGALSRRGAA
jgi:hypothetical protein